jgi:hypothetical protein
MACGFGRGKFHVYFKICPYVFTVKFFDTQKAKSGRKKTVPFGKNPINYE